MTKTTESKLDRKRKLMEIFYRKFYNLIKDNPKIRRILTEKEIENGIYTLVNRIVEDGSKREVKILKNAFKHSEIYEVSIPIEPNYEKVCEKIASYLSS